MTSGLLDCTVTPSYTSLWGASVILLLGFIRPSRIFKYSVYTLGCAVFPLLIITTSYNLHLGNQFYWLGLSASAILLALSFVDFKDLSFGYMLRRVAVGMVLPIIAYIGAFSLPFPGMVTYLSPYFLAIVFSFLIKKENRLSTVFILSLTFSAVYTVFITFIAL
jgi:hypothetical protein